MTGFGSDDNQVLISDQLNRDQISTEDPAAFDLCFKAGFDLVLAESHMWYLT